MSWMQALVSALLFGISTPLSKAFLQSFHPFLLAAIFYLGAALILLPMSVYLQINQPVRRISKTDLVHLIGSLFFGGMVGPVLLLYGLQRTPATDASLLLNLETPATAILAYLVFRENIGLRSAAANAGIVLAGIILSFEGSLRIDTGAVLIALACIAWGLDNNYTASIHSLDSVRCTFLKGVVFGSVNLLIAILLVDAWPAAAAIGLALLVGGLSYGVSIVLYINAARRLGAARSQMAFAAAPFFGAAGSLVFLGESLQLYQLLAAGILVMMLMVLFTESHRHFHRHLPLRHSHRHSHEDGHHDDHHGKDARDRSATHSHPHGHPPVGHRHTHLPDIHHRHPHRDKDS